MLAIRTAQFFFAQFKVFLQTGKVPVVHNLFGEVFSWFIFLLPYFGIVIFGTVAWFLSPFAYLLAPFLMKDVAEGRRTRRNRERNRKLHRTPMQVVDARRMSVSTYMVSPPWVFIFCGSIKWWHNFIMSVKAIKRFIFIPQKWSSKWAILWPPPGVITSILTLAFIMVVHTFIWIRLFIQCLQYKVTESWKNVATNRYCFDLTWPSARKTWNVFSIFALSATDEEAADNLISWDADCISAVIDNSANTHVWSRLEDFEEGTLHYYGQDEDVSGVVTIGDESSVPVGIGTVRVKIRDNSGDLIGVNLEKALYFPQSSVNVISVTYLAHQLGDDDGTWIKTKRNSSVLSWNFARHQIEFYHPSSNLPVLNVYPETSVSDQFMSLFENVGASVGLKAMTSCRTCLPCDAATDLCFLTDLPSADGDDNQHYRFGDDGMFHIGDTVRYTKNGVNEKVEILKIRVDEESYTPYYTIRLQDDHEVEASKEFLFHLDEADLCYIPITRNKWRTISSC